VDKLSEILGLLGKLLEYPGSDLVEKARHCHDLASALCPTAVDPISRFLAFAEANPLETMEELYTATFDLNPACCPYVGYQLVGEDPRRAAFMLELRELYRAAGFDVDGDLPDHAAILLRFLGYRLGSQEERELAEEAMLPAFRKMMAGLAEDHPYRQVLAAATAVLSAIGPGASLLVAGLGTMQPQAGTVGSSSIGSDPHAGVHPATARHDRLRGDLRS